MPTSFIYTHGSDDLQDTVQAEVKDNVVLLKVHEVKSTTRAVLPQTALRSARLQASLYAFFMARLLNTDPYFDFEAYFIARGLDIDRPFNSKFSAEFPPHQILTMNPSRLPPKNLRSLVHQWREWIHTLPKIEIDKYIYITTIRAGRVSSELGFGTISETVAHPMLNNIDDALGVGQTVTDLLDGHKEPSGLSKEFTRFCMSCVYHSKCPWRPELHDKPIELLIVSSSTEGERNQAVSVMPNPELPLSTTPPISSAYPEDPRGAQRAFEWVYST